MTVSSMTAAMVALASLAMLGDSQSEVVVGIVGAATLGSAFTLPTATGRKYNVSVAVAVAAPPLLMTAEISFRMRPTATAILMGVLGAQAQSLLRGASPAKMLLATGRFVALSSLLFGVYATVAGWAWPLVAPDRAQVSLIAAGAAAVAWFVGHMLLPSVGERRAGVIHRLQERLPEWPAAVTLLASGAFFGVVWQEMTWWWATAVAVIPYSFAHVGFWLSERTAGTYRATIQALSRVPEVAGLTPDGHGSRTAELSLAIADEVGMLAVDRVELERAALLHDIGRLTLSQPSILRRGFSDEDIARWGSEMIREAPTLQGVADIVSHQHEPYRRPGEQFDPALPLASKIIRVASAYDHATTELGFLPLEALELLHRGAAYDFDPDVVAATRQVLDRDSTL
ncbi:MAG: HD domain-containing protein [Acidimicrobiia bacterium]|nr:HD domain-containing protein [Acidimicrobiia bacterium]